MAKNKSVPKAHELPSGNWRVQVIDESGKRISITEPSENSAVYAALEYQEQRKRKAESGYTVGEAVDAYIESRSNILSPTTYREYKRVRDKSFVGLMGKHISQLKATDYQSAINAEMKLSKRVKTLAPKTIRNVYGVVCTAVKHIDKYAPCDDVVFVQKNKSEIAIPTSDQIKCLLDIVRNTEMEILIILAAFCGMRRSEIMGLKPTDWDKKKSTLKIQRAYLYAGDGEFVESRTKTTKSTRTVSVPKYVAEVIERVIKGKKPDERIVTLTVGAIAHRYTVAAHLSGMDDVTFHALRHYSASVMLALGVPNKYAAARLGHSTDHMLQTVYQHLMAEKQSEFDDISNKYFDGIAHAIAHGNG